jgi:hypothetical protein
VPPQPVEEGSAIALRVTASDVPAGYEALVGSSFWVEEPFRAPDSVDPPTTFQTARLGCTPLFRQWAAPDAMEVEPVSLFDAAIVPGAVYRIEAVQNPCSPDADCTFSAPLFVTTGQWGDAIAPFAAEGAAQPDFSDIAALVDKFTDADNAPPKNQTDLVPREPDQVVDFSDIAAAVDAFAGVTYSFAVPDRCP